MEIKNTIKKIFIKENIIDGIIIIALLLATIAIILGTKALANTKIINNELKEELITDSIIDKCTLLEVIDIEKEQTKLERLANAFASVESNNNPKARSKDGKYVGWLQISKQMVDAANKIVGCNMYYYEDRESMSGSFMIFSTVMQAKNPELDVKKACKIWNPKAGEWYYNKVYKEAVRMGFFEL